MPGASAGRGTGRRCARCRRRGMIGRAASTWISSPPGRPCRRPCAAWLQRDAGHKAARRCAGGGPACVQDGAVTGADAHQPGDRRAAADRGAATIIATGGLTRLYRRNSASANMAGDGYGLALRAGATLIDMEFVQFFPIGHLAPRLDRHGPDHVGPLPLQAGRQAAERAGGGIRQRYGAEASSRYVVTRDLATYAITKEVEAGRGSPAGGAWLSFRHVPEADTARRLRSGGRQAAGQWHRPDAAGRRGRADRALPHGRHPRGHGDGDRHARPVRRAARRWAAPMAPTACRAMRSPRRWPSAAPPGAAPPAALPGPAFEAAAAAPPSRSPPPPAPPATPRRFSPSCRR